MPAPYRANVFASGDSQRRLARVHAKRQEIEPARLEQLAGDPNLKSGSIARQFGYGRATFFVYLTQHEELWDMYATARLRAGKKVARAFLRSSRGLLFGDDLKIIHAIASLPIGERTASAILAQSQIEPRIFQARLYNLENEKHEIYSAPVGRPPVTNYFLRGESEPPAVAGGQAKGAAA